MNKIDNSSIFKASILAVLIGSVFSAHAAGLGKLTVYSAIGQPLNADILIEATPDELRSLSAKLASPAAFKEAGIDFVPSLAGLHMNVAKSGSGEPVLRLTSASPLNEPFMQFLVELNWTSGRMVREYTFLLDPPEMLKMTKPVPLVAPASPVVKTLSPAPAIAKTVSSTGMSMATTAKKNESADEVAVKRGDTLNKIASEYKADAVSLDQMLVALFNSNRDAFIGGNMNRLRAGKILKLPDAESIAKVDAGDAHKMVVSQARDFNAYRRSLADAVAKAPAETTELQQQATGKIKPQVEDAVPPAQAKDKLEVSRFETSKSKADSAIRGKLEEELIARDKALREASERIAQLEKNLENLKTLAELKSQSGAQLQQQAKAVAAPAVVPVKPDEPVATKPAEPATEVTKQEASAPEVAKPAPPPAKPKPAAKKPEAPPPPEPSFIEENPELVYGGGGVLALLLGYLGFKASRKKKQEATSDSFDAEPFASVKSPPPKATETASVVVASEGGEDISILSDFSEGGALTAEENVDPVAEADVLMAYGRDVQAEEILLEGKKKDPARSAIHVKLLELYSNRKDADKFVSVAQELHDLSTGQGADWSKASTFARVIGLSGSGLFAADTTLGEEPVVPETDLAESVNEIEPEVTRHVLGAVEMHQPPVAEAVQPAEPVEEDASLDFDLDLGTTTSAPVGAQAVEAAPVASAIFEVPAVPKPEAATAGLDFDFDLGSAGESTPVEEAAAPSFVEPVVEPAATPSLENGIDFDLDISSTPEPVPSMSTPVEAESGVADIDFDLDLGIPSEQQTDMSEPPAAVPETASTKADAGSDIDFDLDLGSGESSVPPESPAIEAAIEVPSSAQVDLGLDEISLDLDAPDFDLDLPAIESTPAAPALTSSEIELPALELVAPVEAQAEESAMEIELPSAAAEPAADVADDPEVATKLELAEAYEEMGDVEGARELLNEVLGQGSAAQQAFAQARLDQLGA